MRPKTDWPLVAVMAICALALVLIFAAIASAEPTTCHELDETQPDGLGAEVDCAPLELFDHEYVPPPAQAPVYATPTAQATPATITYTG
jgi:hypothetical protein